MKMMEYFLIQKIFRRNSQGFDPTLIARLSDNGLLKAGDEEPGSEKQ